MTIKTQAQFLGLSTNKTTQSNATGKTSVKLTAFKPGEVVVIATVAEQLDHSRSLIKQKSIPVYFDESPSKLILKSNVDKAVEANGKENITITAQITGSLEPRRCN